MKREETILKGKWLVRFDPADFAYPDILENLLGIAVDLEQHNLAREFTGIEFNKNFAGNTFDINDNEIFLRLKNNHLENMQQVAGDNLNEKIKTNPWTSPAASDPVRKITNTLLYFPFLTTDRRWDTISLTASSIFLGSALRNNGFNVRVKKLQLPAITIPDEPVDYDFIGFTLFEDLLPDFMAYLDKLSHRQAARGNDAAVLAAGGPLVTLNPLQAAYHLPAINLFVRGEAEIMLPGLWHALAENDLEEIMKYRGFLFQKRGLIVISDIDEINRPMDFHGFHFDFGFLEQEHLVNGLEINFSRGCRRGCLFCSQVQGREYRELPPAKVHELLGKYSAALAENKMQPGWAKFCRCLNINDDDILQDIDYTGQILELVRQHGFKLWGIQSSAASFLGRKPAIRRRLFEMISDRKLFVNDRPLVWLGTDSFLKERGVRLGKRIPSFPILENLLQEFEQRDIANYHYWISSDYASNWQEFVREFILIYRLQEKYKTFSIIAHSPFLAPYSTTPIYRLLTKEEELKDKHVSPGFSIKTRAVLRSRQDKLTLALVARVETRFPRLNRLLNNEKIDGERGFFDCLKQKEYRDAFIVLYNFLKQERLLFESIKDSVQAQSLIALEKEIEQIISTFF